MSHFIKRVFRIIGQGKLNDIRLRGLADHPEVERVDTTVALIQALIPLRLHIVGEVMVPDVTRLAGPNHSRKGGIPGYSR